MREIEKHIESAQWVKSGDQQDTVLETPADRFGVVLDWVFARYNTATHYVEPCVRAPGQAWMDRMAFHRYVVPAETTHYMAPVIFPGAPWMIVPANSVLSLGLYNTYGTNSLLAGILRADAPFRAAAITQPNDTVYHDMVSGPVLLLGYSARTTDALARLFLRRPDGARFEFPPDNAMWPRPFFVPDGWTVQFQMSVAYDTIGWGLYWFWREQ